MRLIAKGLSKRYPDLDVLAGADLSVDEGEVVAVIGASGTGKSTLLNCLGLLDRPDEGTIHFEGRDLTGLNRHKRGQVRGREMGFIFQAFHLLPEFTALENVLMAARCAGVAPSGLMQRADELFERVGLDGRQQADVRILSGGERQRISLCRALLMRPKLVLADEPTGNLDPATAALVLQQLLDLAHADGSSLVVVTHDRGIAARADRQVELRSGALHDISASLETETSPDNTPGEPGQD
jgi:lipoprotein-releasing system ATP-binding protein